MNVLITGGTGFIGSRLALTCLAKGHEVRFLDQENIPAEAENRNLLEKQGSQYRHRVRQLARKDRATTNEMVGVIAKQLGARICLLRASHLSLHRRAAILDTLLRPLGIQPPLHRRCMGFFRKNFVLSHENPKG